MTFILQLKTWLVNVMGYYLEILKFAFDLRAFTWQVGWENETTVNIKHNIKVTRLKVLSTVTEY